MRKKSRIRVFRIRSQEINHVNIRYTLVVGYYGVLFSSTTRTGQWKAQILEKCIRRSYSRISVNESEEISSDAGDDGMMSKK